MAPKGRPPRKSEGADAAAGGVRKAAAKKKSTSMANQGYERYIYKILKSTHPKMRISKQAMAICNSLVTDTYERITSEASLLSRNCSKGQTLGSREIQSACRLVLPGELSKHAVAEGSKNLLVYKQLTTKKSGMPHGVMGKKEFYAGGDD